MIRGQSELIRTQQETIQDLKEASQEQQQLIRILTLALEDARQQMDQELKRLQDKLDAVTVQVPVAPPRSFAVWHRRRSRPSPQPGRDKAATRPFAGSFYCTIDTSRVEEANREHVQVGEVRQAIELEMRPRTAGQLGGARRS
ncbi:hypothetical protein VFPBJ_11532 [Purpureocillium lilacinum]|uniref:Uncharacterized protein n=1 Tax=Purpureocillium lilacinum TaxID=33203 RepID=A0A179F603_PURLI|nr:hypothetical protein VFPBJ_11532 [Purpureocillium lilacinum]